MSKAILQSKPKRSKVVQKWLNEEVREQQARYKQIAQAMNVGLELQREQWFREFEQRIMTTGFFVHADVKKIIKPEQIYPKPKRKNKVVY
jgi:uncharacterized protein YacL (UPF0231 family)